MAIDMTTGGTVGFPSRAGLQGVGTFSVVLDFAAALTAKGSALAAADIIETISLPAGTQVIGGGAEVLTVTDAGATTLDIGVGGADTIVDGGDSTATGYLAVGTNGKLQTEGLRIATADTIDVTIKTLTGTLTSGKVRVYVVLADIS